MDDNPVFFGLADKLLEIFVEVFDHLRADRVGPLPALLHIRQGRKRVETSLRAAFGVVLECHLQGLIGKRVSDALSKLCSVHFLFHHLVPMYSPRPSISSRSWVRSSPAAWNASRYSW